MAERDDDTRGPAKQGLASDDLRRAEEVVEEAESRGEDPQTRREAAEQELEDEGLSEEGGHVGQHID
jgi:hypothetical protein